MPRKTLFDITVEYVFSTEKATKYTDGKKEFWVPKSIIGEERDIQVEPNNDGTFTLTGPEHWLREKGLI